MRRILVRPDIRQGLMLTAIFVVALKLSLEVLGPFLIDRGISIEMGVRLTALAAWFWGSWGRCLAGQPSSDGECGQR